MPGTERVSSSATFTVREVPAHSTLAIGDSAQLGMLLGTGSYGKAYACQLWGADTVVKYVSDPSQQGAVRAEYDILVQLDGADGHAPLAFGYGSVSLGATSVEALCEEMCQGSSLRRLVEQTTWEDATTVSAPWVSCIGVAIATAIKAIGSRDIRHGDLSHTNVLLDHGGSGDWHCSVIDFGQAASSDRPDVTSNRPGTVAFSAAEMFPGTTYARYKDRPAADAYSLGALLFYARTWGHFEGRESGSYFKSYPSLSDGPEAIDAAKMVPLDLMRTLDSLGAVAGEGDAELSSLIADLTEFDPRLRPTMEECIARLALIGGISRKSLELRHRARIARRRVARPLSRMSPVARRVGKVLFGLWVAYLTFAVCQTVYIDVITPWIREREEAGIDKESALWHMVDDNFQAENQDSYDPDTPGIREHNPNLMGAGIDITQYGSMVAHYDSDKYIVSSGQDASGQMAYTDTKEALVIPFRDEWREVYEPIRWCDGELELTVSAHGGTEILSYRYLCPRPDSEMPSFDECLETAATLSDAVEHASLSGIEFSYGAGEVSGGSSMPKSRKVVCYSKRSDTCILEASAQLFADDDALASVEYADLVNDLLGHVEVRSTNLQEISAASPYADLTIVSEDGTWQALIKEDEDYWAYFRPLRTWYYHSLIDNTNMAYEDSFAYDFAPTSSAEDWLAQEDASNTAEIVEEGEVPSEGFTARWSLAKIGDADSQLRLRIYIDIQGEALTVEGMVPESVEGDEVARELLLETVEISRNQRGELVVARD